MSLFWLSYTIECKWGQMRRLLCKSVIGLQGAARFLEISVSNIAPIILKYLCPPPWILVSNPYSYHHHLVSHVNHPTAIPPHVASTYTETGYRQGTTPYHRSRGPGLPTSSTSRKCPVTWPRNSKRVPSLCQSIPERHFLWRNDTDTHGHPRGQPPIPT